MKKKVVPFLERKAKHQLHVLEFSRLMRSTRGVVHPEIPKVEEYVRHVIERREENE